MQKTSINRVKVTKTHLKGLKKERLRTGFGSIAILQKSSDTPLGLSAPIIDTWLNGKTHTTKPEYWDYVLALYEAMPDGNKSAFKRKQLHYKRHVQNIDFCKVDAKSINFHRERNGLSVLDIIPALKMEFETISDSQIRDIFYGYNRTAYRPYHERILELLKDAPDTKMISLETVVYVRGDEYIPLTPATLDKLKEYKQQKLLPSKIFKFIPFDRNHPNASHVGQWLNGANKKARKSDIEFVLKLCEEHVSSR